MSNVGYGTLQIIPSAKGFKALLDKEVSAPMSGVGDKEGKSAGGKFRSGILGSLKGIAGPIAGLVAGAAVIDFFKDAVAGASDLSESTSKVGVVFKTSSQQILDASKTSATGMGLSKQAYLEATGTLGNLLVSLDLTPKKAADMSQQMVKLAGDLASFNNVSPEETLDALRAGLTGEAEPLKKFGINMNATTLAAEALKLGLIKNVKEALTPQNKALAAQSLIMSQTKTAQGDFARTSGGLANQQRILAAQFTDVKAKVGAVFLPIITAAVTFLNSKALPAFTKVEGGIRKFFTSFKDSGIAQKAFDTFKTKVLPVLQDIAQKIVSNVIPGVISLAKAFAPLVESAIKLAVSIGAKVLPVVIKLAGLVGGTILTAFKSLGTFVGNNATTFQSLAVAVGAGLAVWKAYQLALATGQAVMKGISVVTKAFAVAQGILNAVMALNPIVLVVIALAALAAGLIYAYKHSEQFRAIVDGAFHAVQAAAEFAWNWIKANWPLLLAIVTGPIGAAVILIIKNWDTIKAGAAAVLNGITTAFKAVVKFFSDLPGKIASALGSAVTWLVAKGKDFITGLFNGVKNAAVAYFTWWGNLPGAVASKLGALGSYLLGKGKDLLNGLKNGVVNAASALYSFFSGLPKTIAGKLGDLGSTLRSAGKNLAQGFINGIGDLVGAAANKARELANAASNAIKGALGIHSPSVVARDLARFFGKGFVIGLGDYVPNVAKASTGLATAAIRGASLPIRSASNAGAITSAGQASAAGNDVDITVIGQNDPEATARIVGRKLADLGV